jgi:hypothetical protein
LRRNSDWQCALASGVSCRNPFRRICTGFLSYPCSLGSHILHMCWLV